jgi:hypothetical protein
VRLAEVAKLLAQRNHKVKVYATPYTRGARKVDPKDILPEIPYQEAWRNKVKADVAYIMYYSSLVWRVLFSVDCPKIAGMHPAGILWKSSLRHYLFRMIGS